MAAVFVAREVDQPCFVAADGCLRYVNRCVNPISTSPTPSSTRIDGSGTLAQLIQPPGSQEPWLVWNLAGKNNSSAKPLPKSPVSSSWM